MEKTDHLEHREDTNSAVEVVGSPDPSPTAPHHPTQPSFSPSHLAESLNPQLEENSPVLGSPVSDEAWSGPGAGPYGTLSGHDPNMMCVWGAGHPWFPWDPAASGGPVTQKALV